MQGDPHQTLQCEREDRRHTCYRVRIEDAAANDSETPWSFRDQNVAVGEECKAPGVIEPPGQRHNPDPNGVCFNDLRTLGRLDLLTRAHGLCGWGRERTHGQ